MNVCKIMVVAMAVLAAGVLASGVLAAGTRAGDDKGKDEKKEYVKVEIKGKLQTGVMAIGGETTGIIITADGARFELDLGKNKEWHDLAEKLNNKTALVTGNLTTRKGVEVKSRTIVTVTSIKAAE
jgi:hypothetical protein